jgi:polyribonucleotide nucleotidyltransferase
MGRRKLAETDASRASRRRRAQTYTAVLCIMTAERARPDIDFFPLTVNYQEKTFAVKIPGGFKREAGRPRRRS